MSIQKQVRQIRLPAFGSFPSQESFVMRRTCMESNQSEGYIRGWVKDDMCSTDSDEMVSTEVSSELTLSSNTLPVTHSKNAIVQGDSPSSKIAAKNQNVGESASESHQSKGEQVNLHASEVLQGNQNSLSGLDSKTRNGFNDNNSTQGSSDYREDMSPENDRLSSREQEKFRRKQWPVRSSLWSLSGMVGFTLCAGLGFVAFQWLTWMPPTPECDNLPLLASDGDRLYCAQEASKDGQLDSIIQGVDLIKGWRLGHPMYRKAQASMSQLSAMLLRYGEASLKNKNGLDEAIAIVSNIPPESPLYEEAQERIAQWQQLWEEDEVAAQAVLNAVENQNWKKAAEQIAGLRNSTYPYWSEEQADQLSAQLSNEKAARQQIGKAKELSESGNVSQLAEALVMVNTLHPQTMAWEAAQPLRQQWAQTLIQKGMEAVSAGNLDHAITVVQHVPIDMEFEGEARNLLLYGYAKRLTTFETVPWQVNPFEAWQLTEAIAAAQQVPSDSRFYAVAQEEIAQWQLELDNLGQLQLAQWIAETGYRPSLNLAIHQAKKVEPNEPRRLQAQTLIANWNQEIQDIVNRPQIMLAKRIAEPGTIEALKAAINYISGLKIERNQWNQGDYWISQWTQQLQALEDRPILVEARQKAKNGNWREAIDQAATIHEERSLYTIAQSSIKEWRTELQLEVDTENLSQARSLASRFRLTQAIHYASQIQPGQPLYGEAQGLINQWVTQRERYRARQYATRRSTPSPQRSNSSNATSRHSQGNSNSYEGYYDSRYYNYHRN